MTNQQLLSLAQSALDICDQLELGQADTPLHDEIEQLIQEVQQPVLSVALIGLTPDSLEQVLAWLYGDAFAGFSVDSQQWTGFVEISLTDGNYAFGLQKTNKQKFDQQQAFMQALQIELGQTKSSIANPFALHTPSSRDLVAVRLLVPDNGAALLESPSLLNAIIAQTNVAMVAAPLRYTLSREDHEVVDVITANVRGFMPLLTVDELQEEVNLPDVGWWEQHKAAAVMLETKLVTKHVASSLPEIFTTADSPQRQHFIEYFYAQKLHNKLDAICSRYQQQAGILEQRKARLKPSSLTTNSANRREVDSLKQFLDERLLTARKDIDAQIQQLSLQQSNLMVGVNEAIDDIQLHNLSTEKAHTIIKLSLDDETLTQLRQLVFKQTKDTLNVYFQQTNQHLQSVQEGLNQQLQSLSMSTLSLNNMASVQTLYRALDQRLEVNLTYRGEMPKRTLMTRLGESRKLIMGIFTATIVLGGVAKAGWNIDLRSSVLAVAPILLVCSFVYTYIQWPQEDHERLMKELDKVRDGLRSELRRVVSDVQRFIQKELFDLLDEQKRNMQKNLKETIEHHQNEMQKHHRIEQQKQQQNQQKIDQELSKWQATERQLQRLRADAQGFIRTMKAPLIKSKTS